MQLAISNLLDFGLVTIGLTLFATILCGAFSNHYLAALIFRQPLFPIHSDEEKRSLDAKKWNDEFAEAPFFTESPIHPEGSNTETSATSLEVEYEFASKQFDECHARLQRLDEKLDSLTKFSGQFVVGLAGFAKIAGITISAMFVVSIGFFLATLIFCFIGRIPARRSVPFEIPRLLAYSTSRPQPSNTQVRAAIAASYHCVIESVELVIAWKSSQYARASLLTLTGIVLATIWLVLTITV